MCQNQSARASQEERPLELTQVLGAEPAEERGPRALSRKAAAAGGPSRLRRALERLSLIHI